VAYAQATGKRRFLEIMLRYAEHIAALFGPGEGQKHGYPGHQELELALVKLSRFTGERRWLDLAGYFVEERGQQPYFYDLETQARGEDPQAYRFGNYAYLQAHKPVRQQDEAVGHSVRAMYLYSAMADLTLETGDESLLEACQRLWQSVTERRMYVTGGIGPAGRIEGFSYDYDLPNEEAYAETCAAIGLVLWAQRMLSAEPAGKYADVLERALYNGVLSGLSLDGEAFFYANPLAYFPEGRPGGVPEIVGRRQSWFSCACCPPNLARLLASLGGYIYSAAKGEVYAHLFIESRATVRLAGQRIELRQETNYPWDGLVTFQVHPQAPLEFTLAVRIPGWSRSYEISLNGRPIAGQVESGYARIRRVWQPGDRLDLSLAMPVERIAAHPAVREDCGRVAVQRGPLVYCLEGCDNGPDLQALRLPAEAWIEASYEPGLLGGVETLQAEGRRTSAEGWQGRLYRPARGQAEEPARLRFIPYYAWANRELGEMIVWIRA
jgi:DUF1680 family protein